MKTLLVGNMGRMEVLYDWLVKSKKLFDIPYVIDEQAKD